MLKNIELGINQIRRRCSFTCIYHNNHHVKLSLRGSFILTSFQHSPLCSLELINYKISSFLSSPFLSYISLPSLCFPGNILSTSYEDQNTIARNCPITFSDRKFFHPIFFQWFELQLIPIFFTFIIMILPYHLQPVRIEYSNSPPHGVLYK